MIFKYLNNFILSFSSFEFISAPIPDPKAFFRIPPSAVDATAVNPYDIKTLLVDDLSNFFIRGKPVFSNGSRILSRNLLNIPF